MLKRYAVLLVMLAAIFILAACDRAGNQKNVGYFSGITNCEPVNYHNGVYYFSCIGDAFGNALSHFIKENPDIEIGAMTGNGVGIYGYDMGYFVVTRSNR